MGKQFGRGLLVKLKIGDILRLDDGRIMVALGTSNDTAARLRVLAPESVNIEFPRRHDSHERVADEKATCSPNQRPSNQTDKTSL